MPLMQEIVQGLGVQCEYCHSAPRGSGQAGAQERYREANDRDDAGSEHPRSDRNRQTGRRSTQVKCVTCHRGVPIPKQLSEIVFQTFREKGAAAAVEQYRDLHQHFYGRAAYDFGEDTLIGVAQPLAAGKPDDAIALLKLNLEFYPQSAKTMRRSGSPTPVSTTIRPRSPSTRKLSSSIRATESTADSSSS